MVMNENETKRQHLERLPRNKHEREFYDLMKGEGWFITKRGWPDFACFRGEDFMVVEVKEKRSHRLKKSQYRLLKTFARHGIKAFKWGSDEGFEEIHPSPLPDWIKKKTQKLL